jgi:hypothetical protein
VIKETYEEAKNVQFDKINIYHNDAIFIKATQYVYDNLLSTKYPSPNENKLHGINRYNHGLANTLRKTSTLIIISKLLNIDDSIIKKINISVIVCC